MLFDVNQNAKLSLLLRSAPGTIIARLLPDPPRRFKVTVIGNADPKHSEVVERFTDAGENSEWYRPLGLSYPADVYSLSHVALAFPITDPLYGLDPERAEDFGISLGSITARGERGGLIVPIDFLSRISSNPFFPYIIERIGRLIDAAPKPQPDRLPWSAPTRPALPAPADEGLPAETETSPAP